MTLAIISHTEHYRLADGTLVGLSSTVNEINHLKSEFDMIYHVAMMQATEAPANTMAYSSDQIIFVPIPTVGGPLFKDKLRVIAKAPQTLQIISHVLKKVDYFQFRAPTGIGMYVIPYLTLFVKIKGWYKYAGNWKQKSPPLAYGLQRWLLKNQNRTVTINGHWEKQPKHCLSFENPCLSEKDLRIGRQIVNQKVWPKKLSLCFVGRLETEKGVALIIEALRLLSMHEQSKIEVLHIIGEGKDKNYLKTASEDLGITILFHGVLSQQAVFDVYQQCHIFLLPSKSEGFPKVIIEAMNFGCIPVVSNVSSIGHYITHGVQGFLIDPITPSALYEQLQLVLQLHPDDYYRIIKNQEHIIHKFTFSNYHRHLKEMVL